LHDAERLQRLTVNLTDRELAHRRRLHRVDDESLAALARFREVATAVVDGVVADFYRHELAIPEVAAVIDDPATLHRLHVAQRKYVLDLFEGRCDCGYVENRLHIGCVHERLGIEPRLYLAAMHQLRETIGDHLARRAGPPPADLPAALRALDRLLSFDTSLVMDTYIATLLDEVEQSRRQVEDYAQNLERKVARRTRQLEELARRDPLTDLYNPRALHENLKRDLAHAKRRGRPLSLMYFDIDDFKLVNDSRGHQAGDEVLKAVAGVLRRTCREEDLPCRYGGDEFCVVVVDGDLASAESLSQRFIAALGEELPGITVSIGLAQAGPDHYGTADDLIGRADRLMYEAKKQPGFQIRS